MTSLKALGLGTLKSLTSKSLGLITTTVLILPLLSCSQTTDTEAANNDGASQPEDSSQASSDLSQPGTLQIKANGEDFVRQGFVDKDGWQVSFDHVYVTLTDVVATQSEPPFEAGKDQTLEAQEQVKSDDVVTVDLAAGDEDAEPILVKSLENAPGGRYNALAWRMVAPTSGEAAGYPLMMVGSATKAGETIPFNIQLSEAFAFNCGDFIGDERKGILTDGETAEVEATFHFDHIFGDAEAAADDEINTGALGFEVLAAIAETNESGERELNVTSEDLKTNLTPENQNTLKTVLTSLGHVGEGHCEATLLDEATP
ncbi:MAG: hypothetical protein AAFQ63_14225 [Cyanobacteria bacterium J06621_11]